MYKESSINLVREADITKVISHYADLKRAGSLYECTSPLNPNDKTPSFKVSTVKNNFVCYSTQHSGDGIKFVMLKENCNFVEAVEKIAGICNIYLEREEETEEVKKKRSEKEQLLRLVDWASKKYQTSLSALPVDHWAKQMISDREINEETILTFGIGYAPENWHFLTHIVIENGKLANAKIAELVSTKDSKSYDFFNNRLMFPIQDVNGNVIAFGGRCSKELEDTTAKYLNSRETIIYSKTGTLYGLFQAKNAIAKSRTAVLTEGYTDVTSLHQNGCDTAIATCGTALTDAHCKLLNRFAAHVIICRDNDGFDAEGNPKAGTKAALKDIDILLKNGFKVSVVMFPEGEDPDSYARKLNKERNDFLAIEGNTVESDGCPKGINEFISENYKDAVIWKTEFLKNQAANDPDKVSECVTEVCKMIFNIKDDVKLGLYTKECSKIVKQPIKVLKDKLSDLADEALAKTIKSSSGTTAEDLGLPPGADFEEFKSFRYVTLGNSCWFQGRNGNFFKGTNFRIEPLYHIPGMNKNKRLCEVINEDGIKSIIDFDTSDFITIARFEEKLLASDFYVLLENFGKTQFTLMKNRLLSQFRKAEELTTLGWQKKGFWAFANCVHSDGIVKNVDNFGIVEVITEKEADTEYHRSTNYYYSPAFSEIHKHNVEDADEYENDRYFIYKQAPVTLNTWMDQMIKVYEDKAITGITSVFFTIFRDLFVKTHAVSPILFLSGEKGSGKTKYAESLASLFTYKQPAFDLNASTLPGFSRRIARTRNAITILEEFNDNIMVQMLQSIKGSYDNRGREVGAATGDNRTKVSKVNCFLVVLSQYLSTWDDNSITSRSVIQHFIKPTENFTQEKVNNYNLLKDWEEIGLTSLILEIVVNRSEVEKKYIHVYAELMSKLKKELSGYDYQERMLQNYVVLMTPITVLWEKFKFPFKYESMYNLFKEAIIDSSDLIVESEGLSEFWKTLEYLLDRQPYPLLVKDMHFKIDKFDTLMLQTRKGESDREWKNPDRKQVLLLRLSAVHQLYHKEVSTREGVDVIGENTLRNYFKSKKYYIGAVKSHNFSDTSTSAYVFDYSMMEAGGILNLIRKEKGTDSAPEIPFQPKNENDKDLPF